MQLPDAAIRIGGESTGTMRRSVYLVALRVCSSVAAALQLYMLTFHIMFEFCGVNIVFRMFPTPVPMFAESTCSFMGCCGGITGLGRRKCSSTGYLNLNSGHGVSLDSATHGMRRLEWTGHAVPEWDAWAREGDILWATLERYDIMIYGSAGALLKGSFSRPSYRSRYELSDDRDFGHVVIVTNAINAFRSNRTLSRSCQKRCDIIDDFPLSYMLAREGIDFRLETENYKLPFSRDRDFVTLD